MNATCRSLVVCALASLLVAACGSSPPVRYFSLSPSVTTVAQDDENAAILGFGPIRMPEYLNRSHLVTRGTGQELKVDEFNRWAEPLENAVHRIVSSDVDNAVDGLIVTALPWESAIRAKVDYRLLGEVNRFDADRSGRVTLDVQWGVSDATSRETVVRPRRSRYEARAGSPDDPASIASAMNEALAQFSADIAREMQAVLGQ